MKVGVVDIGTNSMRLLIATETGEVGRWVEVTGLGSGVDRTGRLSQDGIVASLAALRRFGRLMDDEEVIRRKAIATSASRDAANRREFFDEAAGALGVRPTLISGEEEAGYAFAGATLGRATPDDTVVSDIGGGSTEFVTAETRASVDIGSVRLTDRTLPDRPPTPAQLRDSIALVRSMFDAVALRPKPRLIGIAGTWTSLAGISLGAAEYDRAAVHGMTLGRSELGALVDRISVLTMEETMSLPSLDPKRAPVILAGAIIAQEVMVALGADRVEISENDTLDGVAAELIALP